MESSTTKGMISGSESNESDRISSLPVDVIHNILSFLCIFDVFQMSVLSKRWNYICTTLPFFRFDMNAFRSARPNRRTTFAKFKEFIYRFLTSQRTIKLVRFLLCCSDHFESVDMLPFIHAATQRNVQQLVLEFWLHEPFELPDCLVTCESLQVLKLSLCGDTLKLPNHLGFRQLKLLHLEDAELSDEHLTSCLFSECHLLEKLVLHECHLQRMALLYIASPSLLYIIISEGWSFGNCEIKISCPSLKSLKYKALVPKDIIIKNLFSIEDVHIFFNDCDFRGSFEKTGILVHKMIKEVTSVSVLKLCKASLKGLYEEARQGRLSPISFYKLKSLKLKLGVDENYMQVMILLLKCSPNLEVLKLWYDEHGEWSENWVMMYELRHRNPQTGAAALRGQEGFHSNPLGKKSQCLYKMQDPKESIVCLDSHLKSIQLIGFKNEENEIELLRFFLKYARVLEKLRIVWAGYAHKSEETSKEILKIPRTSSHALVTFHDAKLEPRSGDWYDK